MSVFQAAELLVPREELLEKWAVIACDQFTSQPEYWEQVREQIGDAPSAYRLIFPEAELGAEEEARIAAIGENMRACLEGDVFRSFPDSFVYVERSLMDGSVRRGVVGVIDLEAYDYRSDALTPVRATEQTVIERIPPRVRIRRAAPLELSHVLLLMDDRDSRVLDSLAQKKESLPTVYSFPLMLGGGRITGRLMQGEDARALEAVLADFEEETAARFRETGKAPFLYAVGDGNHSLAAAKDCWEALKQREPALAGTKHPARYAMVELQNIRDAEQQFEPIHRLLANVPVEQLLDEASAICAPGGYPVDWVAGKRQGTLFLDRARGTLPVAILQPFLDGFLQAHGGRIDYIHGTETAATLADGLERVAFLLPGISKDDFFPGIAADGVLPRKTFSMGHAQEKRYYLEARRITADER